MNYASVFCFVSFFCILSQHALVRKASFEMFFSQFVQPVRFLVVIYFAFSSREKLLPISMTTASL